MARPTKQRVVKVPIEPVLRYLGADHVPTGHGWRAMRCGLPGHDDMHPSARVNHDTKTYQCLVCGFYGDGIDLLVIQEGLSFGDARALAEEITHTSSRDVSPGGEGKRASPDLFGLTGAG